MTSSIGISVDGSLEDVHSNRLLEENNVLKEQLELVKNNLAAHQERAATTEISMMEAIMQMKNQI